VCDVVVIDGALAGTGTEIGPQWEETLVWLTTHVLAPLLLVSDPCEELVLPALRHGGTWLPADVAVQHPVLFAGMLEQAAWLGQQRQRLGMTNAQLHDSHARVDRLLALLWEAAPGQSPTRWFSQRHMLERLDEEVARTHRYGGSLAVLLGEMCPVRGQRLAPEQANQLATWAAGQIAQSKRRCDVAGQYGLDGFMLLLPQARPSEAIGACRRLAATLAHPPHAGLPAVHACFGLASVPADLPSIQSLLRRAEERLDRARDSGDVVAE
jgi:diguanylate cyclase (GGDEF)-like protein